MIDLKSMTLEEISDTLKSMGEPAFRGKQVFTWLHKGATSFDEMTNLSKALREKKFRYRRPTRSKNAGLYSFMKETRGLSNFLAKSSQQV